METMYKVTLEGERRNFFTDADPSIPTPYLFNEVEVAEFRDSYTPTSDVKQRREADAREALANGSSRTARINYRSVAMAVKV
jgi:hypothetical protein